MKPYSFLKCATIDLVFFLTVGCGQTASDKAPEVKSATTEKASSEADEQALRQLMGDLTKALQAGDAAALEGIYADSYSFMGVDGTMSTKAERVAAIKSGRLKYKSLTLNNINIRTYGDAAVVTFDGDARFAPGNERLDGKFRTTATFIKSDGRWMQVASGNVRYGQ